MIDEVEEDNYILVEGHPRESISKDSIPKESQGQSFFRPKRPLWIFLQKVCELNWNYWFPNFLLQSWQDLDHDRCHKYHSLSLYILTWRMFCMWTELTLIRCLFHQRCFLSNTPWRLSSLKKWSICSPDNVSHREMCWAGPHTWRHSTRWECLLHAIHVGE